MTNPKKVLVACGTGVATSTVVAQAVQAALHERGIAIVTRQCKASEVPGQIEDVDLVISTTPLPKDLPRPAIVTLAFLTGIGKERELDRIAEILSH